MVEMQRPVASVFPSRAPVHGSSMPFRADTSYTIGDMARDFNISLRALRFYEHRGLLNPRREGTNRIYGTADRARLQRILKGKQLGFTLSEIREMLARPAANGGSAALELSPAQIREQLGHLERQRTEIEQAIDELRAEQKRLESV